MASQDLSLETIEDFLAQQRIALIGVSRKLGSFSVPVFQELCRRGYDVVPVNPNTSEFQGLRCFARVQDIQPPVQAALLMTSPDATDKVVRDCAEAGISRVWMHRAGGQGAVSPQAVEFCRQHGIRVVPGECPFMFLPHSAAFHRLHGFIRKLTGHYPKHAHASPGQKAA
ncbi:MAG TPA: CoA-binding protein [Candidatus Acidoferrum sp.]|nr:CoA-binding protein [Candidatus Acidoferrum sp.]